MSSKRDEFRKIGKAAGIKSPEIEYIPERKAYTIGITIQSPDKKGFYAPSVGMYHDLKEAQENIKADLTRFLDKHPQAREKVTGLYDTVTLQEPRAVAKSFVVNWIKRGLGGGLFDLLNEGYTLEDIEEIIGQIESIMSDIESPKKATKRVKKSSYKSILPDAEKAAITWEQPEERLAPVYHFEITCPYCGSHVSLERFSPKSPAHCGADSCQEKHERELARIRKQRQRARQAK